MRERLRTAERILAVREQLRQAAQWRLAEIGRERAAIEEARGSLLAALGEGRLGPLLAESAVRRLARLAADAAQAEAREQEQDARVRKEALAAKRAERTVMTVRRSVRAQEERAEIAEAVEASARRADPVQAPHKR